MLCGICLSEHTPEGPCAATMLRGAPGGTQLAGQSPVAAPPQDPEDALLGTSIGSFQLVRKLGRGGMGTVFLGEHSAIGSKVAVKLLHPHLASNPALVARFYAEARAVNLIGHENIVNIFDMNVVPPVPGSLAPGRYYLIMEHLEGRSLASLTKRPVEAAVAIPIMMQICDALQAAHAHSVVHRDLKPENVFLVKRGRDEHFVKVLDFGIAKLFSRNPGEDTGAGTIIGTPEYMAPEQTSGDAVDGRADIYSLGVMGYLLATGKLPFTTGGLTGILLAHRETVPPAPHELNPAVSLAWSNAIMQALGKRPSDRFHDAGEFRQTLERALGAPVRSAPGANPGSRPPVVRPTPTPASRPPVVRLTPQTPQPLDSRHVATFGAKVKSLSGELLFEADCAELTRGGVFLCAEGKLPALFTRLKVALQLPFGELECLAEVVRHVSPLQSESWGMPPGFGVQFVELTPALKEVLARVVAGLPVKDSGPAPRSVVDDPQSAPLLAKLRSKSGGDHYALLSLSREVEFSEIRARGRELQRELEGLRSRPLSTSQATQLEQAQARLQQAVQVLGTPASRLDYDAHRGNFRGVARCISAGITVTELEESRRRFLAAHPTSESRAYIHFTGAHASEREGVLAPALEEYERALMLDPMNLRYQQRYWALKKRLP